MEQSCFVLFATKSCAQESMQLCPLDTSLASGLQLQKEKSLSSQQSQQENGREENGGSRSNLLTAHVDEDIVF